MPLYLHQWNYKDQPIKLMLNEKENPNRGDVIRTAVEAFGGKLQGFYYAFGDCDGVAISEFPDEATALACLLLIFGQGRIQSVRTSTLFTPEATQEAVRRAQRVLGNL